MKPLTLPKKVHDYHVFKSVLYAYRGLVSGFGSETNLSLQLLVGVISIGATVYFDRFEYLWLHVVFLALTVSMELMNTAFEYLCDLVQPQYSDKVKAIKDIAAGAVLFAALSWLLVILSEIASIAFGYLSP